MVDNTIKNNYMMVYELHDSALWITLLDTSIKVTVYTQFT